MSDEYCIYEFINGNLCCIDDQFKNKNQFENEQTNILIKELNNDEKIIDLNKKEKIKTKVILSNNRINYLRENFQLIIDAPMRLIELCTEEKHIDDIIKQAVQNELIKQKEFSLESVFTEITSDWIYENINSNRGFTSQSIWMRNPQGERILVKIEDHPLSAVNEWLSYQLGIYLHLPVNHVQIAIYENNLVTLHKDVKLNNEQIYEFIHLPKKIQKLILNHPIILLMDLFDHFIDNCDRNPRNILITIPNNIHINHIKQFKIHFIDHSSCFGMGKLNLISAIALKLHSKHFSILKFNPIEQANQFEKYLYQIPIEDHIFIKNILNHFSKINYQLIDLWFEQIKSLLTINQFHRIKLVFYKQINIIRKFIEHFQLHENNLQINNTITCF